MVSQLRTYLKEGFSYAGLEISGTEEERRYFLLELKKTKNQLRITNSKALTSLEELPALIPKKNPLFLCINTPNILTKKVDMQHRGSTEALVNQAFPNIDLNGIYYEVIQTNTQPLVTISKKQPVDAILTKIRDLKLHVSGFSLGISPFEHVLPFLEDGQLQVANHHVQISDKTITSVMLNQSKDTLAYTISGLELSSKYLLSFSQLLGNLNQKTTSSNFEAINTTLQWAFKNFRIFNQLFRYALLFFIGLLLLNFLAYHQYHEEVGALNEAVAANSSQKEELTVLDASVQRKQERLETLSASSNSKATYYLDLFAQRLPSTILLNEIKYQPLAKPVREKKPIMIEEGRLLVSGISKDVNAFSLWVEELEKYPWVSSVETLDYTYVGKTTSNFLIEIGFHEDR